MFLLSGVWVLTVRDREQIREAGRTERRHRTRDEADPRIRFPRHHTRNRRQIHIDTTGQRLVGVQTGLLTHTGETLPIQVNSCHKGLREGVEGGCDDLHFNELKPGCKHFRAFRQTECCAAATTYRQVRWVYPTYAAPLAEASTREGLRRRK